MSTLKKEKKISHPQNKTTFHLKELEKEQTEPKVSRKENKDQSRKKQNRERKSI